MRVNKPVIVSSLFIILLFSPIYSAFFLNSLTPHLLTFTFAFLLYWSLSFSIPLSFLKSLPASPTAPLTFQIGHYLIVLGLLLITIRAIAKIVDYVAHSLIDAIHPIHDIRFSWVICIEIIGLTMKYEENLV